MPWQNWVRRWPLLLENDDNLDTVSENDEYVMRITGDEMPDKTERDNFIIIIFPLNIGHFGAVK